MKKHIFLFAALLSLLTSCKILRQRDFHTNQALPERLPALGLLVHERSFLQAFDGALERDIVVANVLGGPYMPAPWNAYAVTDQALEDAFHVLGNELGENLSASDKPLYGHAKFKLLYYQRRNSGWGWSVASVATLFIPNVFGMPVKTNRVVMELQMEIEDAQGNVVSRYVAEGTGKARVAAYHGYEATTATRKANLLALQDAMSKIKSKLNTETATVKSQLETVGPIPPKQSK